MKIYLRTPFQAVLQLLESYFDEDQLSFSNEESDSLYYIKKYAIPTKYRVIGMIWINSHILLIFEDSIFIGYVEGGNFVAADFDFQILETNLTKLRNQLSPSFLLPTMLLEWHNEKTPSIKSDMLPYLIEEAQKCLENQPKILELLDKI